MNEERKRRLTPWDTFVLGDHLARLEWALTSTSDRRQIAFFLAPLRQYEMVERFEFIGEGSTYWHDLLANLPEPILSSGVMDELRKARTHWGAVAGERLAGLYLITPQTMTNANLLMRGIDGLVGAEMAAALAPLERSDLNNACACLLVGSPTPAEYIALRAAESLLRRWYEAKTHKRIQRGAWGSVLDKLEDEYPQRDRPKEITLLGYLKLRRDEVAHPERVSTTGDAETTLMNVCHLIVGTHSLLASAPVSQPASHSGTSSEAP